MHEETTAAAAYIASLFTPSLPATFADELARLLTARYQGHWHSDDPERGSAFRCLAQTSFDRPEPLVKAAFEAANVPLVSPRIARWTVFVDPGCVSARVGEGGDIATLQEIWGTLPQPEPLDLGNLHIDNLPALVSPAKRSRAIQIVRPESRHAMLPPATPASHVAVIPPTPLTAKATAHQPCFAPIHERATSVTPTGADPFVRPLSRSSSVSSDGGASSDRGSDRGSVFSATSHETLFPTLQSTMTTTKRPTLVSHHRHTSSLSTNGSSTSSTNPSLISRPPSAASGSGSVVTEHSNGKVGVLGGGVLLGLPSTSTSGDESGAARPFNAASMAPRRRREGRGRSRVRSANYHAAQQQAMMAQRWPFPDSSSVTAF